MAITPWKTLDSQTILRDRWLTLRRDRCETATGAIADPYYVEELPDWVQIVAFDGEERLLITHQYRHAAGLICAEIPCGSVESEETPMEAARRELLEETGCIAQSLTPLTVLWANPARSTNRIHAFIARGTRRTQPPAPEATEEIDSEFVGIEEVLAMIDRGAFAQALHVGSVLLALHHRLGAAHWDSHAAR